MGGTSPSEKIKKEINNARNKSRKETCYKETRYRKAYGYARNKNEGSIARANPRENEEARTYPYYPGDRREHSLFWKVRWSVWQRRLLLYERLPYSQAVNSVRSVLAFHSGF